MHTNMNVDSSVPLNADDPEFMQDILELERAANDTLAGTSF